MRDEKKTKPQLINELSEIRQKVASLETAEVYRKQAEELLSESKSKYQLLVDNLTHPLTVYDADGLIIYMNGAGMFGIEPEQAVGKYLHDLFPPNIADIYVERARKIFESGEGMEVDDEVHLLSGSRWYHSTIQPMEDPYGKVIAVQTISYDITERRLVEERVEHLNLVLRSIRDVNQLIVTEKDPGKLIKGACDKLTQTRGYQTAWIALLDQSGTPIANAESGFGSDFAEVEKQLKRRKLPKCAKSTLMQPDVFEIEDRSKICRGCALLKRDENLGAMCIRLEHDQHVYGVMCVNLPANMTADTEEQSLFIELASDIALAIHSIQEEKERHKAEQSIREREEEYSTLVELSPDGIVVTKDTEIIFMNQRASEIVGREITECVGKDFTELVVANTPELIEEPQNGFTFEEISKTSTDNIEFRTFTLPIRKNTGELVWVKASGGPIFYKGENVRLGFIRDITERKQAEEALRENEENWRSLVETAPNQILSVNREGTILYLNRSMSPNLVPGDLIGKNMFDFALPEQLDVTQEAIETVFSTGKPTGDLEIQAYGGDGSIRWYSWRMGPVKIGDEVVAATIVSTDISGRKIAEEELKKSEAFNFALFQYNAAPTIIVDREGRVVKSNLAQRHSGHSLPDIGAKMYEDYASNHEIDMRTELMECIRSGKPKEFPEQKYHDRHLSITISPFSQGAMIMANDVTERKQAEDALREKEGNLRLLTENLHDVIVSYSLDGKLLYCSPNVYEFGGYNADEEIGSSLDHYIALEEDVPRIYSTITEIISEKQSKVTEFLYKPKDREPFPVEVTTQPVIEDGEVVRLNCVVRDITERKQAEEALRQTEEKWRSLTDNTNDIIQILDTEGNILYMNKVYPPHTLEDVIGMPVFEFMDEQSRQVARYSISRLLKEKTPQNFEIVILLPGNNDVHFDVKYVPVFVDGEVDKIIALVSDIEERKEAEKKLRKSEERLRQLSESTFEAILVHDKGNILLANDQFYEMFGRKSGDSFSIREALALESLADVIERFQSGNMGPYEATGIKIDGTRFPLEIRVREMEFGGIMARVAAMRDITERKQAEEALKESEAKYSAVVQKANDGISIAHNDRIVFANEALSKITDYSVSELHGKALSDVMTTESAEHALGIYRKRMAGEPVPSFYEVTALRKDGTTRDVEISAGTIPYSGDTASIAIIRDITERKRAEQALTESRNLLHKAENLAQIGGWELNIAAGGILSWTDGMRRLYEFPLDFQPTEESVFAMVHPDDISLLKEAVRNALKTGKGYDIELRTLIATGKEMWVRSICEVEQAEGKVTKLRGTSQNITERKRAEEALRESEEKFRLLIDNYSDPIVVYDRNNLCLVMNAAAATNLGGEPKDFVGRTVFDFLPNEAGFMAERNRQVIESGKEVDFEDLIELSSGNRWFWSTLQPTRDMDNNISGVQVISYDITERKRAEELTQLQRDLAYTLSSMIGLEEAAAVCLETAIDTTGLDCGGFYVIDRDTGGMDLIYAKGLAPAFIKSVSHYDAESPNAQLVMSGKPSYVLHSELGTLLDDERSQEDLHAIAVIPVVHEGQSIGCLNIASHKLDKIPLSTQHILESIAAQIGSVIVRLQAEEALQESEEKYRNVVERANDVIIIIQDGVIKYANPLATVMIGYTLEESIGESLIKFVHPDEAKKAIDRYTRRMAGEVVPPIYETALLHKDGHRIEIELSGGIISYQGRPADLIIIRDITERKRAEKELKESEEKLRTIFENANDAIIYVNHQGAIIDTNSKLEDIFGYTREEAIGRNFAEFAFADSDDMDNIVDLFAEALETEGSALFELEIRHTDGHTVLAEASTTTIVDETGIRGALTILRDVTERKKAEEETARAKALEELDILRTALLASVSHELRTPLTSIKGLASTLVQPDVEWDKETQQDFLNSIVRESDRLNHIVGDLLDMSRLESGTMTMRKTECTLSSIVREIRNQLNVLVANNRFEIVIPPDLPVIYVDEIRIGEVIINLVSNAVSYSEDDTEITLHAQQHDNEILVSVTDQGIGIADEHLDKVFDRFYRLEGGAVRRRGGSGLGLAICRGIVEAHSGRIWVERNDNEGSKFNFCLPIVDILEVNSEQNVSTQMNDQEQDVPFPDVPSSTSIGSIRE